MPYVTAIFMPNFPTEKSVLFNTSASTAVKMATGQNRKPINASLHFSGVREVWTDLSVFLTAHPKGIFYFNVVHLKLHRKMI